MSGTGYGRPPKHAQFKSGQSGNPKGRPPRTPAAVNDVILKLANQTVRLREGDQTSEITTTEAVRRAQLKTAIGGSPIAQRDYLASATRAATEKQQEIDEEVEWARNYVAGARALFADAAKRGLPEPLSLHPDDVIINEQTGVLITGPFNEERRAALDKVLKARDAALLQSVLDDRAATKSDHADPETAPGTALILMFLLESALPARFRLTQEQLLMKDRPHRRKPKRELVKEVREAWSAAGLTIPRGTVFPPMSWAMHVVATVSGNLG